MSNVGKPAFTGLIYFAFVFCVGLYFTFSAVQGDMGLFRRAEIAADRDALAAQLAARHATEEEIKVLKEMVAADDALVDSPTDLAKANRRFHEQIHLASHNRYLVQQLDMVHRTMALMATTSLAAEGRGEIAQAEHLRLVQAIENRDAQEAEAALRDHISVAFMTRLRQDAETRDLPG